MSGYTPIGDAPGSSGGSAPLFPPTGIAGGPHVEAGRGGEEVMRVNRYETCTPINMQTEAALCYLLGPITGR